MADFDLYGSTSDNLQNARELLEAALNIQFVAGESLYQGGDYYRCGDLRREHFVLKHNIDPIDGEQVEKKFPESKILL